jgi:hypothetical protein
MIMMMGVGVDWKNRLWTGKTRQDKTRQGGGNGGVTGGTGVMN